MDEPSAALASPKPPVSKSRRYISPGLFLVGLLLFGLPWVDVSWQGRKSVSQSGYQAVYGGVWLHGDFQKSAEKQRGKPPPLFDSALLLAVYAAFLLAGIFFGINADSPQDRAVASWCCAACALACIGIQSAIGLPLDRQLREMLAEQGELELLGEERGATAAASAIDVRHTLWFWSSIGVLVGAAAASVVFRDRDFGDPPRGVGTGLFVLVGLLGIGMAVGVMIGFLNGEAVEKRWQIRSTRPRRGSIIPARPAVVADVRRSETSDRPSRATSAAEPAPCWPSTPHDVSRESAGNGRPTPGRRTRSIAG
jgi:hypothetical protein